MPPEPLTAPLTFRAATEQDLPAAARWLLAHLGSPSVVLLDGPMGAGKTTFTRALCDELGVTDHVASPTYGLVHEYRMASGVPIYHFDLYRLRSGAEALDLGIFEYFDSGYLCLVEWPDRLGSLLDDVVAPARLTLEVAPDESRVFTLLLPA